MLGVVQSGGEVGAVKYFTYRSKAALLLVDHLCYLCLVFVMVSRVFIAALWSPAGKGLTS